MNHTRLIVVALGGNAISQPNQPDNIEQQFHYTRQTAACLADLFEAGYHMVITHGNGPQVGNVLRRVELAAREVYRLPLHICVADTQGGMGFMIAACLNNELRRRGIRRRVAAIVTTVVVDPNDPDFAKPSKPIGDFYDAARAAELQRAQGWHMKLVPGRGHRRVVPSPLPREIVEIDLIRKLAAAGEILIAAGGGGVPVVPAPDGGFAGVDAVIDKDRTSALLAATINAELFLIVTGEPRVCLHYNTPQQQPLDVLSLSAARQHLADGQFPPGSMGPKIDAAIDYLERSQPHPACAIVTDVAHMRAAVEGHAGTRITHDPPPAG